MSVIIHPSFPSNQICFIFNQIQKGRSIFAKQNQIFIREEIIYPANLSGSTISSGEVSVFLIYSSSTLELYTNFRKAIKRAAPARMNRCGHLKSRSY